jgi:maleylpyruvate isomerase
MVPDWSGLTDSAARFLNTAQVLTDPDVGEPSALPGWTRAHLLTHVARAADSRTGLLRAAQAGQVGQQYPSEQARAAAIDADALRPPSVIRVDLLRAVKECLYVIRDHPSELWDAPGVWLGPPGRRPVRGVVPGLRRELEYHHVDLAVGYQPADWPDDFARTELAIVTAFMNDRADAPPMTLTDSGPLQIGTRPPMNVAGPPAAMLAWLSGRSNGSDLQVDQGSLPELPPLG